MYRDFDITEQKEQVEIWYCNGCGVVHLVAGSFRISFDRNEFEDFTNAVVNIYCGGITGAGPQIDRSETDGMDITRSVLTSREIH